MRTAPLAANRQLLERVFPVEEELKAQRDVMIARFEASDRRFESIDLPIGGLIKTLDDGATIHVHDPKAPDNFRSIFSDQSAHFHNESECLTGADCAVI